jgi:hypothetical protein
MPDKFDGIFFLYNLTLCAWLCALFLLSLKLVNSKVLTARSKFKKYFYQYSLKLLLNKDRCNNKLWKTRSNNHKNAWIHSNKSKFCSTSCLIYINLSRGFHLECSSLRICDCMCSRGTLSKCENLFPLHSVPDHWNAIDHSTYFFDFVLSKAFSLTQSWSIREWIRYFWFLSSVYWVNFLTDILKKYNWKLYSFESVSVWREDPLSCLTIACPVHYVISCVLYEIHVVRRLAECLWVHRFSPHRTSLLNFVLGNCLCWHSFVSFIHPHVSLF